MNRADVESMLAHARPNDELGGYMHLLSGDEMIALCRAWLAVDAARVAEITREDWLENFEQFGADLIGQRVRIVPEAP